MVKKVRDASKKVEKALDADKPRGTPVRKDERYPAPSKGNISSGSSVESFGDRQGRSGKDDRKVRFSPERRLQTRSSSSLKQRVPTDRRATRYLSLSQLPTSRRKTRQELQNEKGAAIAIQSAWRGCQVRREMSKMKKAATKIQATFRGYKTRKELLLGLCEYSRSSSKKKTCARKDSRPVSEFLSCVQQFGLIGTCSRSRSLVPYNNRPRSCLTVIGDCTLLRPELTFLKIEADHGARKATFTCSSLNILATDVEWQRYHDAAIIIQAAWRGYQVRKTIGIMIETQRSHSESFSFNYFCEKIRRKDKVVLTKSQFRARRHDAVLLGFVPRIRNINIYTVVKGLPASQKPSVSIQVMSPHAVIQGYQRDRSIGVQGLYSVRSQGALQPTQVFVHVDTGKEFKIMAKAQKPEARRSKGAVAK